MTRTNRYLILFGAVFASMGASYFQDDESYFLAILLGLLAAVVTIWCFGWVLPIVNRTRGPRQAFVMFALQMVGLIVFFGLFMVVSSELIELKHRWGETKMILGLGSLMIILIGIDLRPARFERNQRELVRRSWWEFLLAVTTGVVAGAMLLAVEDSRDESRLERANRADITSTVMTTPDLRGINLAGRDLQGISLSGRDLTGANLSGADLTGANLSGANLSGVNLWWADLTDAHLFQTDFTCTWLGNSILNESAVWAATFDNAKILGTDFRKAVIVSVDFSVATIVGVDFTDALVGDAAFSESAGDSFPFGGQVLFDGMVLTDVDFSDADLQEASFEDTRFDELTTNETTLWPQGYEPTDSPPLGEEPVSSDGSSGESPCAEFE